MSQSWHMSCLVCGLFTTESKRTKHVNLELPLVGTSNSQHKFCSATGKLSTQVNCNRFHQVAFCLIYFYI